MNKRLVLGIAFVSVTCSTNVARVGVGVDSGTGDATSGTGDATSGTGGATSGTGGVSSGTGGTGGVPSGTGGGSAGAPGTGTGGGTAGAPGTGGTAGRGAAGASGTGGAAGAGSGGTGTGGSGSGGVGGAPSGDISVLQHHNNPTRDGVYIDARLTNAAAMTMHIDTTFAASVIAGPVYAQPLYLVGTNGGPNLIIAATAQNRVYALNAATGVEVWNRQVGTPVTAGLCGRPLNPLGITGTPVIDAASRTIYLDAMTNMGATDARHMVHALDIDNLGVERTGAWPVDLNATARSGGLAFLSPVQNQRAALALIGGTVFVPFGGHIGDCDAYHGWLVGIPTTNPAQVTAWATTAFAGGIWGSSGIASDGTSLYVSTGNTKALATSGGAGSSPVNWGGGEAVIKFPTSLTMPAMTATTDYFYPSDWAAMDIVDADLGGTGAVLFSVPGANPSNLIMALGKDRKAYLLNRANLGGLDAQPLASLTNVAGQQIINAAAAYTTATGTYVVFKNGGGCPGGGLTAIKVTAASPPTMAIAWCGGPATNGSPAVTMTDATGANAIVWIVGSDNRLYGVNGDTGAPVPGTGGTTSTMAPVQAIQTPIVANGRIFVASNSRVYAFTP